MRVLRVLIVLVQMGLIIKGLVLAVGVFFYTMAWVALVVTSFFPAGDWEATSPPKMG